MKCLHTCTISKTGFLIEQSFMDFLYHEINRKIYQMDVLTNNHFHKVLMSSADIFVTWLCTYIV